MAANLHSVSVKTITIVGGGTAGWMAAAALSERYHKCDLKIRLVESPDIASVGVGEATVPGILSLHHHLNISEREFIRATGATFKLGIEFRDWYQKNHQFFHPFAAFGAPVARRDFYQCWLKLYHENRRFDLEDFCLAIKLARAGRFAQPDDDAATQLALYSYAYHFDAGRYAQFLADYAAERGVERIQGTVVEVRQNPDDGYITSVRLQDGCELEGDLFIDCSGFRGLLINQSLQAPFEDWSDYLPCDSAVVVQSENVAPPLAYTVSTARSSGWQWRIPLQHRTGNGYVYCSRYQSDDSAREEMLSAVEGPLVNEPRIIRFNAGMRHEFWNRNCVALGLASGFLEPLESTSISLIQTGVEKLMQFMPDLQIEPEKVAEANRLNRLEYERVRDFLILHYISSRRDDTAFWRDAQKLPVPVSLAEKIEAFETDGTLLQYEQESFSEQSWIAMYNGFGRVPQHFSSGVSKLDTDQLSAVLVKMRNSLVRAAEFAPSHQEFLDAVYTP